MIVIEGERYPVDGIDSADFIELPGVALSSRRDWRPRSDGAWVRSVCLHTRMGLPVRLRDGIGPNLGWDKVLGGRFTSDQRQAGAHIAIDSDGSFCCLADLQRVVAYHAGHVNEVSVGIEMYQAADGGVWESTLRTAVLICDVITRVMGIQRQYVRERTITRRMASPSLGVGTYGHLAHMPGGARGRDFVGVFGHRNVTRNRGPGDPGDEVFELLRDAGYEGFMIDAGDDLDVWARRQHSLGMHHEDCDGIPGPNTVALLAASGRPHGMWADRPGDDPAC